MSGNRINDYGTESKPQGFADNTEWDSLDTWNSDPWSTPKNTSDTDDWGGDPWSTPKNTSDTDDWGGDPWSTPKNTSEFEAGGGKLKNIAKTLMEALKRKIGSPETQEMAKQVARDYGRVAMMGALDSSGITKDGRIRKRGVIKALLMPKRAARKAAMGAASGLTGKARQDTEIYSGKFKERLVDESTKRSGRLGGIAVRQLIKLSPV